MKKLFVSIVLIAVCAAALAQDETSPKAPGEDEIKSLIKALGSDTWKERTDAEKKLIEIGWPAGPALQEAAKSDDPEISRRAKGILDKICYLPDDERSKVDSLFEQMKTKEDRKRSSAFSAIKKMGESAMRYLGTLLAAPSDNKIEMVMLPDKSFLINEKSVEYTIELKNAGEKPAWVPEPGTKIGGSFRKFGTSRTSISWSRGGGRVSSSFSFLYLEPGESYEYRGKFNTHMGRVGIHNMYLKMEAKQSIEYTKKTGECETIPVSHFAPEKAPRAVVAVLPKLKEGDMGDPSGGLAAGVKVKEEIFEKGKSVAFELVVKNVSEEKIDFFPSMFDNNWYVIVPVAEKKKFGGEGTLPFELPSPIKVEKLDPGASKTLELSVNADLEPGEYHLLCGLTKNPSENPNDNIGAYIGKLVTNAVKFKVAEPEKK